MNRLLATTAILLSLVITTANAAPYTALQFIDNEGAIVFGNATTTSEIIGTAIVGGDLGVASETYQIDSSNAPQNLAGYAQVSVYGNLYGVAVEGLHQTVALGSSDKGSVLGSTPTTGTAFPETIAQIQTTLVAYSAALAAMPATGTYDAATGVFSGPAGSVFDVTTSELNKPITGLVTGDVINVSGDSWTDIDNYLTGDALWNFDATSLDIEQAFAGYILAPFADALVNTTPICGITAASYTGEGEIHCDGGDAPGDPNSAPEPGSLALLGVGLLGVGFIVKRRLII